MLGGTPSGYLIREWGGSFGRNHAGQSAFVPAWLSADLSGREWLDGFEDRFDIGAVPAGFARGADEALRPYISQIYNPCNPAVGCFL